MADKASQLAGPGISTYEEVEKNLPRGYSSLLDRKRTQRALYDVKAYIERELARGARLNHISRHILGLFQNVPGARKFRRHLSENAWRPGADAK